MIIFLAMALWQYKAAWIRRHIFFQKFFKITLEKTKNIAIFLSIILQMQTEILLVLFVHHTVAPRYNEPRYNEDPVLTNNIWKPGRITVEYVETNPVITTLL